MTNYENIIRKQPILDALVQYGWTYQKGSQLPRISTAEPLLLPVLRNAIQTLNQDAHLTDLETENLIEELRTKTTSSGHAKDLLKIYRDGIPATPKKTGLLTYINLFDENPAKNTYTVADEITHTGHEESIRCDILLYINGIPLVNIESKDPTSRNVTWADAYQQIRKYQTIVPELYKYVQIGIAADATIKYFPTSPWNTYLPVKIQEWNAGLDQIQNITHLLTPSALLDIIKNYTFIRQIGGNDTKILPRYIQYRASEKIISRVTENLAGTTDKNKGLIWHWQGSGKTLTMIYAANKLYKNPLLEKPTIFFITDRTDLEDQLAREYQNIAGLPPLNKIATIRDLISALKADDYKGTRELMTVLVQKFKPGEFETIEQELKIVSGTTIQNRKNIILFIDEAHRTQEGILSGEMRNKILTSAFAFAFTGTPNNAENGKNTFTEFSYPPDEEYLDKYDMGDSNKDGFTLPITYQPRLFDANISAYSDAIEQFLDQSFEDIDQLDREQIERNIKKRIKAYKIFLEHPDHIKKCAEHIADHFTEIVEPQGFKALIVCSGRKACVLYKQEIDRLLGPGIAEVVMTYQANEHDETLQKFQKEQRKRHKNLDETTFTNEYRDNFKEEPLPKILIVTDKLLAGFDAPKLQTIYLDKLIKGNKLLQAITRCNRPYPGKEFGLIIDYAGVLTHIEKALRNYNRGALGGTILNKQEIAEVYIKEIGELKVLFGDIDTSSPYTIEEALKYLMQNPEDLKEFAKRLARLTAVRKIIESTPAVIDNEKTFTWFCRICDAYKKLDSDTNSLVVKEDNAIYTAIHQNVTPGNIRDDLPTWTINNQYFSPKQNPVKAVNIVFTLEKFIKVDKYRKPAYESLLAKIERTISEWREKKITDVQLCEIGPALIMEGTVIEEEAKSSTFSDIAFGVYTLIKSEWGEDAELKEEISSLDTLLIEKKLIFPGWQQQPTVIKEVEREIKSILRKYGKKHGKSIDEIDQLFDIITKGLKYREL